MNDLRQAAQQALKYLDAPSAKLWPAGMQHRIITALRAALAEPDIDPVDEYRKGFIAGQIDMRDRPEEQPDPVAWMTVRLGAPIQTTARNAVATEWARWGEVKPLYAAPPQREPLTDEVIADLWHQNGGYHHHFARALERWLKGQP